MNGHFCIDQRDEQGVCACVFLCECVCLFMFMHIFEALYSYLDAGKAEMQLVMILTDKYLSPKSMFGAILLCWKCRYAIVMNLRYSAKSMFGELFWDGNAEMLW